MYSRNVDFSDANNQKLIERLAQGLNIRITGGSGVVILSTVTFVGTAQCTAAGLVGGACTNLNHPVITNRIVIGNASARSSAFGTPSSELIAGDGDVANYMTNTSARADGLQRRCWRCSRVMSPMFRRSSCRRPTTGCPAIETTGVYCRTVF